MSSGSKFERWFAAQHGPRRKSPETDAELQDKIAAGRLAAIELERRRLWDEKRESALYAWQIRDAQKMPAEFEANDL